VLTGGALESLGTHSRTCAKVGFGLLGILLEPHRAAWYHHVASKRKNHS